MSSCRVARCRGKTGLQSGKMLVTLSKTQQRTDRQDTTNGDKKNENKKVVQIETPKENFIQ